jgi:peptidoglycan/xylan/chitin deacetylase (PgdA/CDA1 family)
MFYLPILTYHKISYQKEFGLNTIEPDKFKLQLEILKYYKYYFRTFKSIDPERLVKQQIILTFDDGYECIYRHAYPLMQELQIPGVIFIISDYINQKNDWEPYNLQRKYTHLSRDQIIELHQSGFEIGSHGRRHLYLNNKPDKIIIAETADSKKRIEDLIGDEVISFCYPFGRYNQRVARFVQHAGYKFALGGAHWLLNTQYNNWQLSRHTIYSIDSQKFFLSKISQEKNHFFTFFSEWIIQNGAWFNIIRQNFVNINK